MKKLLLSVVIILGILSSSFSQIEKPITKKHLLVGGSFGFDLDNSTVTNNDGASSSIKSRNINTNLYCGYFILNQLAIGIKPGFEVQWYSWINDAVHKTANFTVNSFLRYYFKFGLFGEGTIGVGTSSSAIESDVWRKTEIFTWGLGVGYSVFITNTIAIEPVLGYKNSHKKEILNEKNIINSDNLYLTLGFQIYLKTGKE